MADRFGLDAILQRARGETPAPAAAPKRRPLVLVGVSEVAAMLGCSRQNVSQLAKSPSSGFPAALELLSTGPVFDRRKVEDWIESRLP
jgi:predicted DNA-binding transcriptional regulator AlpA